MGMTTTNHNKIFLSYYIYYQVFWKEKKEAEIEIFYYFMYISQYESTLDQFLPNLYTNCI